MQSNLLIDLLNFLQRIGFISQSENIYLVEKVGKILKFSRKTICIIFVALLRCFYSLDFCVHGSIISGLKEINWQLSLDAFLRIAAERGLR